MNENDEKDMIETAKLVEKLTEFDKRLTLQADDRHRVNNILHKTLGSIVSKTEGQDQVLSQIQEAVKTMAESVHRVEACLIGDPKFDRQGLIKDVIEIKAVNIALHTRVTLAEDAAKANAAEIKSLKRTALWTTGVLGGIGAIITWIKSSGIGKIFGP